MCGLNISESNSAATAASLPYYKERHIIIKLSKCTGSLSALG
jgi:hypothetical protein